MVYVAGKRNKKIRVIVDAHTATFEKPWSYPILKDITKLVIGKALIVVVANAELQKIVYQNYGVKPLILEDGVPQIGNDKLENSQASVNRGSKYTETHFPKSMRSQNGLKELESEREMKKFKVAVICSFASDEPIEEIIEAAKILSETTRFFVTGDSSRLRTGLLSEWEHSATNVLFTGFLEKREYFELLKTVDAIMVLSKRYHNMLSGAHEALALEKPLITSDWPPLRNYFTSGTTFVSNSVNGIVNGVTSAQLEKNRMEEEMRILKQDKIVQWEKKISAVKEEFIEGRVKTG
jgi:glycosyltransferase involved in cell wall biosynthesis